MLFILALVGFLSVEGGLVSLDFEKSLIPVFNIGYTVNIDEAFSIHENINYWEKEHKQNEGSYHKKYKFSKLGLNETALFKMKHIPIEAGAGISLNLLKNYVEEANYYGSYSIIEYYTLNSVIPGLHLVLLITLPFKKFFIFFKLREEIILAGELESPFYTHNDIKETAYSIGVSF